MQIENKIKYSALIVFIVTAYFSIGHHQSDENFQILEFAQYKLGEISTYDLPWEFSEKLRPSIQPWIAFSTIKFLNFINISNPFTITTIFRIFSAIFLWLIISAMNKVISEKYFPDKKWSQLFYFASFFFWFVPYISVRFSSENYSALFLLLGLYFLIKENKNYNYLVYIGIFFGLSVLFRYQLGVSVVAIYLWLIFKAKVPFSKLIYSFISFAIIIAFGSYLDYLFYNEFVFVPFNYLYFNIISGGASEFGTSPWWYYFVTYLAAAIPPMSFVLLFSFLKGSLKLKNDIFTWSILPFILVHLLIAHKEMRFLFPISYIFIFISIYGLMEYFKHNKMKRYHRRIFRVSAAINVVLLLFMMFKPANEKVANFKYLYNNLDLGKRTLVTIEKDSYDMVGLKTTFYDRDSYLSDCVETEDDLAGFLEENEIDSCFLVYGKYEFKGTIDGYKIEKVFSVYPDWFKNLKWIDLQKTLSAQSIHLLSKEETD